MMTRLETYKMLALSTSHLRYATARQLDNDHPKAWAKDLYFGRSEYGWFVSTVTIPIQKFPDDLREALDFARRHDCTYVMFDRDVEPIAELPTFDW